MTSPDMTEENAMADMTRAQLAAENEQLRARIAELEAGANVVTRPAPTEPSFGLSEGVALDIREAQNKIQHSATLTEIKMNDPFTGRPILVTADDWRYDDQDQPAAADDTAEADVTNP